MRDWYRSRDYLATVRERVIPETSAVRETVDLILLQTQLLQATRTPETAQTFTTINTE
jgi:hypothetical protein